VTVLGGLTRGSARLQLERWYGADGDDATRNIRPQGSGLASPMDNTSTSTVFMLRDGGVLVEVEKRAVGGEDWGAWALINWRGSSALVLSRSPRSS
jgi:hypothetical protein